MKGTMMTKLKPVDRSESIMSDYEFESWQRGDTIKIGEYTIKPKRDFGRHGHLVNGVMVRTGWIIVKDGCLAAPGGQWAATHDIARRMVGALMASKGDAEVYHGLMMLTRV